jgi:hypothetical protein
MSKMDLCVMQRTYTDKQGQEKKVWLKVGELNEASNGREYITIYPHINFAALPRKEGSDQVFVSMFAPKGATPSQSQRQAAQAARGGTAAASGSDYDIDPGDIPF